MSTTSNPPLPPEPSNETEADSGGGMTSLLAVVVAFVVVAAAVAMTLKLSGSSKPAGGGSGSKAPDPQAIADGKLVANKAGCMTCHSDDGTRNRGPTWKGMYGHQVTYDDGSTAIIDDAAIRDALVNPTAKIIEGYEGIMPPKRDLSETDIKNLLAYMRSLS